MTNRTQLQSRRHELKYVVDESEATRIREFFGPYLSPDPFTAATEDPTGYLVCSLYLDSPALDLYDATCQGRKNRFKLRVRVYDDDETSPAFLEIKRRDDSVVKKKRGAVTRAGAGRVLLGKQPSASFLHDASGTSHTALEAMDEFCRLRDRVGARGCTYVLYQREAYGVPGNSEVRVTFDRHLEGGEYVPDSSLRLPARRFAPELNGIVLELKFTDRFPHWMRDLVQTFELERTSVAKYCKCVEELQIRSLPRTRPSRSEPMNDSRDVWLSPAPESEELSAT